MKPTEDAWSKLGEMLVDLKNRFGRCRAVNVNTSKLKNAARSTVQYYFRESRLKALQSGITDDQLGGLDECFQALLKLTSGNNLLRRYKGVLANIQTARTDLDGERERLIGQSLARQSAYSVELRDHEIKISETLKQFVPGAGLSYQQACSDLAATDRLSYRGTANELREALRELLDHLAPDSEVNAQTGFKLEEGQTKPTMRQKVRHILRARGQSTTSVEAPGEAVVLIDNLVGKLTRNVYNRSSISAHVSTTRSEVCQLKMYVDSVLGELLEIHRETK